MKAFYKVKRAQSVIEPVIGRDSLLGLIFQLFEGLRDMFQRETQRKGYNMMKMVEQKMLAFFDGDDRNPYFEAVYISFYHYYHQQQEASLDTSPQTMQHQSKQIVYYLEKCLTIQLLAYGKYHSSVLQTLHGLGDAYFRLDNKERCRECLLDTIDISEKINAKQEDVVQIQVALKLAQTEDPNQIKKIFEDLDKVEAHTIAAIKGSD